MPTRGSKTQFSLFGFSERLVGAENLLPYALLLSVTSALYAPSIYFDFVADDQRYVLLNLQIQGLSWAHLREIWTEPYFSNYAPLHNLLMAVIHSLAGLDPFAFHLAQLLLHATCVCALYFVLSEIESKRVALVASLLFAVYPPNIETVAWVSELKSTLAFLFFLASFWFYARLGKSNRFSDGAWCAVLLILSLLAKISSIVAPGIFFLYDYKQGRSQTKLRGWSLGSLFFISALFAWIHLHAAHSMSQEAPTMLIDQSITDFAVQPSSLPKGNYFGGFAIHLLNLPRFLLFYARMIVFPYPLSFWHMMRIDGGLSWQIGLAWIAVLAWLWVLHRSSREYQFWQLWFIVFLIPVLQIIPNSVWVADRYLYVPAIGAFVLFSKLLFNFRDRQRTPLLRLSSEFACVGILLGFGWLTNHHLPVWRSEFTLWSDTAKGCMTSAFCHYGLGEALVDRGRPDLATKELYRAAQLRPASKYLIYLGDAYLKNHEYRMAIKSYELAQRTGEMVPISTLAKMAKAHYELGEFEPAGSAIRKALSLNPNNPMGLTASAFVDWKLGNHEAARTALRTVLRLNAEDPMASRPVEFFTFVWTDQPEVSVLLMDLGPL